MANIIACPRFLRPMMLSAGLLLALPSAPAWAEEVECESEWGRCEVSNDNFDTVFCTCESADEAGDSGEDTGANDWQDLSTEELMEVCEDHLKGCDLDSDSSTTGDDDEGWLTCSSDYGKCKIKNDPEDLLFCTCDNDSGSEASGGDAWASLSDSELLEICEESLSFCAHSDDVTTGSATTSAGSSGSASDDTNDEVGDDTGEADATTGDMSTAGEATSSGGDVTTSTTGAGEDEGGADGDATSDASGGDSDGQSSDGSSGASGGSGNQSATDTDPSDTSASTDTSPDTSPDTSTDTSAATSSSTGAGESSTDSGASSAGGEGDSVGAEDQTGTDAGDPQDDGGVLPKGCNLAAPSNPAMWTLLLPVLALFRRRRQ